MLEKAIHLRDRRGLKMIYKLVADWDEINIDDFVQDCQNNSIDVCFDGDKAYLYGDISTQRSNLNIWKRENKNFFLKEITEKPKDKFSSFVNNWICERFERDERERIEQQQQAELCKMKDNIDKAREEFKNRIKFARQQNTEEKGGAVADGQ